MKQIKRKHGCLFLNTSIPIMKYVDKHVTKDIRALEIIVKISTAYKPTGVRNRKQRIDHSILHTLSDVAENTKEEKIQ